MDQLESIRVLRKKITTFIFVEKIIATYHEKHIASFPLFVSVNYLYGAGFNQKKFERKINSKLLC
jgi:hypothetical protein